MSEPLDPWSAARGRFSTGRLATDPITGRVKRNEETIVEFARRHDWETRRYDDKDDYVEDWVFIKGLKKIAVTIPKGYRYINTARFNRIQIPNSFTNNEKRTRVERAIVGMDCTCTFHDWPEPHVIDPLCLIHGDRETPEAAEVLGQLAL